MTDTNISIEHAPDRATDAVRPWRWHVVGPDGVTAESWAETECDARRQAQRTLSAINDAVEAAVTR